MATFQSTLFILMAPKLISAGRFEDDFEFRFVHTSNGNKGIDQAG